MDIIGEHESPNIYYEEHLMTCIYELKGKTNLYIIGCEVGILKSEHIIEDHVYLEQC